MVRLETELAKISGLSFPFLAKLGKLQIKTVKDLLWHFPTRYEDFSRMVKIADLKLNQSATIRGVVKKVSMRHSWRRKIIIVEVVIADETGAIKAIWFNQPYIGRVLQAGRRVNFAGRVAISGDEVYLQNPTYEIVGATSETKHTAGLISVYPETRGLTSKGLRYLINAVLKNLPELDDFVPENILQRNELPNLVTALKNIHFPKDLPQAEKARQRFAFQDLFLLQLVNLKNRLRLALEKAPPLKVNDQLVAAMTAKLPFVLTEAQKRSLGEIFSDLQKSQPMNRLLQGDVGSGKTVVAALAALVAADNDKQTAFMAPTEVLARQHYRTLSKIFSAGGALPTGRQGSSFGGKNLGIGILTGSEARSFYGDNLEAKVSRAQFLKNVAEGKIKIVLGTHALISDKRAGKSAVKRPIEFQDLALAIVDEQHRFGVEQRAALVKQEREPGAETTVHFLSMSATPIPRTLSLTLFGDLELSIIDELPSGRKEIITKIVAPSNRKKAYDFIKEQIKAGRQAFVICPRIAAAESAPDTAQQPLDVRKKLWLEVKNVTEEYERLSKKIFPDLKVAMLHGRMKGAEKAQIMSGFASGEINILVSTSVIEVGVDVPNATIMMIEGADRFGLAQLYQFRGRVGRAEHQSYCLLFTDSSAQSTHQRLDALLKAKNGFELAEKDLAIRGPGEFIGDKQTGIPDLAMKALNNIELIKIARAAANSLLKEDRELNAHKLLRTQLESFQKQIHLE
ncbi:MAG: ATP-dependent DNA helicase [Parcubacteria group bacterium GW2011_GWA1_48_11b]|uniref:Probable DNA 3'-5' helicase RecG n=1 Tax=Candidatus Harrisonbacteria bacterium RIFCSPHIGHO2_12_FULL_48_16 TaxID=1798405 RepID=A0A1G1ZI93_9BACT|nr:MAG: ATP-dependent DNA helicase [Parcubacteria group bacterium GW2011_GWA1_48_11b]OGY64274.1 MAG: ATP-dependent DNA helicase RecG [Candidatus Harrisonbacteria bacterium RIFCSPHIGHO2_12_FULL_48_16]